MERITVAVRDAQRQDDLTSPPAWAEAQGTLASEAGLALLVVEGHQPPQLATYNNNSICHSFQSSMTHAHLCDPYCGEAFRRAQEAGEPSHYRCHAGMHCFAAPVEVSQGRGLAVIGGRAFLASSDYRELVERFRIGDLRELLSADVFRNVLFGTQAHLDNLAARLQDAENAPSSHEAKEGIGATGSQPEQHDEGEELGGGRNDMFAPGVRLEAASQQALKALATAHNLTSVALYLRRDDLLVAIHATGRFKVQPPRITLRRKARANGSAAKGSEAEPVGAEQFQFDRKEVSALFPLVVAGEIKGALAVVDTVLSQHEREAIGDYCEKIAVPLELLNLREELARRMRVAYHLQSFTEKVNAEEPEEAYSTILRHSTELLRSERASLLLYDESANELQVKAAVGPRAKAAREARVRFGEGISGAVMREGRPLVVRDLGAAGHAPAPAERKYKTGSFISYPLLIGGRRMGVLNMTDKAGGGIYDDFDLNLLDMLAPQMALALDRAEWHQKATQFQLLSITDPLTTLLNRRYLEERLGEELERSKRHRFPMSFLMIDIDNFKEYNDRHGHQAGDLALGMVAQCLKSALRSDDVAARYGGEEFSVLLPQTSLAEAHVIAERIRLRVETSSFPHHESQPGGAVTVSIGISAFGQKLDTAGTIIGSADQALYLAKSRGKNRVEAFTLPPSPLPS